MKKSNNVSCKKAVTEASSDINTKSMFANNGCLPPNFFEHVVFGELALTK